MFCFRTVGKVVYLIGQRLGYLSLKYIRACAEISLSSQQIAKFQRCARGASRGPWLGGQPGSHIVLTLNWFVVMSLYMSHVAIHDYSENPKLIHAGRTMFQIDIVLISNLLIR